MSLRFLFMLMYTPTACAVSLWRPFYGLLMLVFLYYFRPEIWNAPTWFRPILFITVACLIGWAMHVRTLRFHPLMAVSLACLLGTLAGALMAKGDREVALGATWILTKLMIVQFLTMQLVDTPKKINQFLWANVSGMLWNLKTIIVTGAGGGDLERVNVAAGQGGGANYLALVLIMMMPFFAMRFQHGSRREKMFILVLFPFYVLGAVFTGSRGGILQMMAVMSYLIFKSKKKAVGFATAALCGIIVLTFLPQAQWDRLKQGVGPSETRDFAAQSRILLWKAGWTMFREDPALGKGMDNYPLLSPRYVGFYAGRTPRPYTPGSRGPGFVAHSTWFQALGEGGLAMSLPLFALFPMAFYFLWKTRKVALKPPWNQEFYVISISMAGLWIAFCVGSTFGSLMKIDFLWWYMGLTAAIHLTAQDLNMNMRAKRQQEIAEDRRNAWRTRIVPGEPGSSERVRT